MGASPSSTGYQMVEGPSFSVAVQSVLFRSTRLRFGVNRWQEEVCRNAPQEMEVRGALFAFELPQWSINATPRLRTCPYSTSRNYKPISVSHMKKKSSRQRIAKTPVTEPPSKKLAQRVIQALAKRQPCASSTSASSQNPEAPVDRDLLRAALASCLRIPKSRVTNAMLNKHIRQIEADAHKDAVLVAAYLDQLIVRLEQYGCTSQAAIEQYLDAQDQVLTALYAELGRPHPSPTNLLRLSVQYALDARKVIDVPAEQIDIRRRKAGFEVAVIPRGQVKIRSLPYPGQVIANPFANHLLSLVLQQPPAYSEILRLIESLLQRIPADANGAQQPKKQDSLIEVDLEESIVFVAGRPYPVEYEGACFVNLLASDPNVWFGPKEYAQHEVLKLIERMDRVYKKLPRPIKSLIEGKSGAGYRLVKARLAELRQKSSVVTPSKSADNSR